jgi:hypothetical protein
MAVAAARVLARADEVDDLVLADRDEARARAVASELGQNVTAAGLDIANADALAAALQGVDIVLNCAGPFYRLGRPVLEAAIATGAHYLDICDDWEPTLEMLELDDDARQAGVTAVIGMGASPGTSNLLAVVAMNELDQAERVFTAWRAGAGVPRPTPEDPEPDATAAVEHWVHNCSEPIKVWRDGGLVEAWGLEELTLTYPGRGEDPVWLCGHPEPLTIPRVRRELRESLNVMTARRGLIDAITRIADRVKSGELDVPAASKKLLIEPNMWGRAAGPAPGLPDLFAVAEGVKDGRRMRVGTRPLALPDADMGEFTGIPLAVATLMLVRGQVDSPGVQGPEGAVDPDVYFRDLAQHADEPREDGRVVEVVTDELGSTST